MAAHLHERARGKREGRGDLLRHDADEPRALERAQLARIGAADRERPPSSSASPVTARSSVDLPAPFGPTRPTTSPACTSSEAAETTASPA